jgi:hypothetical protein
LVECALLLFRKEKKKKESIIKYFSRMDAQFPFLVNYSQKETAIKHPNGISLRHSRDFGTIIAMFSLKYG